MSRGFKCAVAPNPIQERNPSTMHRPAIRSWLFVGCWILPLGMPQAQFNEDATMGLDPTEEPAPEQSFPESNADMHPYEHVHHAYAQVLNVQPVYEVPVIEPSDYCDRHDVLLSDESDEGDASASADVTGETRDDEPADVSEITVEENCVPDEVIDQEPVLVGYDVEYRYRGEVFISRLNEYPGDRLRIRVAIAPIELTGADEDEPADVGLPPERIPDERQENPAFL